MSLCHHVVQLSYPTYRLGTGVRLRTDVRHEEDEMSTDKQTHDVESNNAESLFKLGERYEKGEGVPQCNTEAMKYYRSAALIAMADAKTNLAEIYDEPTFPSGLLWALRFQLYFAERGVASAQAEVAEFYYWGLETYQDYEEWEFPWDRAQAAKWAFLAAEQGLEECQDMFGKIYWDDCMGAEWPENFDLQFDPQNELEEVRWLTWAQGTDHFINTGPYFNPDEARQHKEFTKAVKIYRALSLTGDTEAQFKLATMHEQGEGLPKDECEAYAWLSIAASRGEKEASENLQRLSSQLTPEQVSKGQQRVDELLQRCSGLFE
jgi:TPR repeat protein